MVIDPRNSVAKLARKRHEPVTCATISANVGRTKKKETRGRDLQQKTILQKHGQEPQGGSEWRFSSVATSTGFTSCSMANTFNDPQSRATRARLGRSSRPTKHNSQRAK